MSAVFNANKSILATTSSKGFSLFKCPPHGPFQAMRSEKGLGGVAHIALMGDSPLVVVVPLTRNRTTLQVFQLETHDLITETQFDSPILNLQRNDKRMVVVLEGFTHVFDSNSMDCLVQLKTANPANPKGICSLSALNPETGASWFAYPQCAKSTDATMGKGEVFLLNCMAVNQLAVIPAHKTPIACLNFSNDSNMLASCSDKGTVIRIWSPQTCQLLYSLRRGQSPATLFCLSFSPCGRMLAASGSSGTLHCFPIPTGGVSGEIRASRKQKGMPETRTVVSMDAELTTLIVVTLPLEANEGQGASGGGGGGLPASSSSSMNFGMSSRAFTAVGSGVGGGGGAGGGGADGGYVATIYNMAQHDSKQEGFIKIKEVQLNSMM